MQSSQRDCQEEEFPQPAMHKKKKKKKVKPKSRIHFSDMANLQKVGKSPFGEIDENATLLGSEG